MAGLKIETSGLGKIYGGQWVLKNLTFTINEGEHMAFIGKNGSGKSTLIKMLAGNVSPDAGEIKWQAAGRDLKAADIYKHIAFAAPYLSVPDELTLSELLSFHGQFKKASPGLGGLVEGCGLGPHRQKPIKEFSSGMRQRVKLLLALGFAEPLLLLDEPTANLDEQGIRWFHSAFHEFSQGRTVLLASNIPSEYAGIERRLGLSNIESV